MTGMCVEKPVRVKVGAEIVEAIAFATNPARASADGPVSKPFVEAMLNKLGWQARKSTPQEFMAFVAADAGKWPKAVKAAGLKVE